MPCYVRKKKMTFSSGSLLKVFAGIRCPRPFHSRGHYKFPSTAPDVFHRDNFYCVPTHHGTKKLLIYTLDDKYDRGATLNAILSFVTGLRSEFSCIVCLKGNCWQTHGQCSLNECYEVKLMCVNEAGWIEKDKCYKVLTPVYKLDSL